MMMEITMATMGRLMKNLDMAYWLGCAAADCRVGVATKFVVVTSRPFTHLLRAFDHDALARVQTRLQ